MVHACADGRIASTASRVLGGRAFREPWTLRAGVGVARSHPRLAARRRAPSSTPLLGCRPTAMPRHGSGAQSVDERRHCLCARSRFGVVRRRSEAWPRSRLCGYVRACRHRDTESVAVRLRFLLGLKQTLTHPGSVGSKSVCRTTSWYTRAQVLDGGCSHVPAQAHGFVVSQRFGIHAQSEV